MSGIDSEGLRSAAEQLLQATILGEDLRGPLQTIADKAHARGAGITRCIDDSYEAIPSASLEDCFKNYRASGWLAPRSRAVLIPNSTTEFTTEPEMPSLFGRNPFYQEFMRPQGIARTAAVRLNHPGPGAFRFVFFRREADSSFEVQETVALNYIVPYLQAATLFRHSTYERQVQSKLAYFSSRGLACYLIASGGRVVGANDAAHRATSDALSIIGGRLRVPFRSAQGQLDKAIASALAPTGAAPGMVKLSSSNAIGWSAALIIPLGTEARDLFSPALALVALVEPDARDCYPAAAIQLLSETFGMTARESEVVAEISRGRAVAEVAGRLRIGVETTRNHLKRAMQKLGVHSQTELATTISNLFQLLE